MLCSRAAHADPVPNFKEGDVAWFVLALVGGALAAFAAVASLLSPLALVPWAMGIFGRERGHFDRFALTAVLVLSLCLTGTLLDRSFLVFTPFLVASLLLDLLSIGLSRRSALSPAGRRTAWLVFGALVLGELALGARYVTAPLRRAAEGRRVVELEEREESRRAEREKAEQARLAQLDTEERRYVSRIKFHLEWRDGEEKDFLLEDTTIGVLSPDGGAWCAHASDRQIHELADAVPDPSPASVSRSDNTLRVSLTTPKRSVAIQADGDDAGPALRSLLGRLDNLQLSYDEGMVIEVQPRDEEIKARRPATLFISAFARCAPYLDYGQAWIEAQHDAEDWRPISGPSNWGPIMVTFDRPGTYLVRLHYRGDVEFKGFTDARRWRVELRSRPTKLVVQP